MVTTQEKLKTLTSINELRIYFPLHKNNNNNLFWHCLLINFVFHYFLHLINEYHFFELTGAPWDPDFPGFPLGPGSPWEMKLTS